MVGVRQQSVLASAANSCVVGLPEKWVLGPTWTVDRSPLIPMREAGEVVAG